MVVLFLSFSLDHIKAFIQWLFLLVYVYNLNNHAKMKKPTKIRWPNNSQLFITNYFLFIFFINSYIPNHIAEAPIKTTAAAPYVCIG